MKSAGNKGRNLTGDVWNFMRKYDWHVQRAISDLKLCINGEQREEEVDLKSQETGGLTYQGGSSRYDAKE